MEINSLFVGIAFLILLAVTSLRYGADSRDGFRPRRGELAPRDIVWDVPSAAPKPLTSSKLRTPQPTQPASECAVAPCAA